MNGCEIVFSNPIGRGLSSVREAGKWFGDKQMARNAQHRRQHPFIKCRFPKLVLKYVGVNTDDLDHVPTQDR